MTTNSEQEKMTTMTAVADALMTLEKYATDEIKKIAHEHIEHTLEEFGCSDEGVIREVLEDDGIQAAISFHIEKVMERGWNEGRIQARGRFLTEDWELQVQEEYLEIIGKALTHEDSCFRRKMPRESSHKSVAVLPQLFTVRFGTAMTSCPKSCATNLLCHSRPRSPTTLQSVRRLPVRRMRNRQ